MNWNFVHLFPEAMSLYGEYANLTLLGRYLELLGDQVTVTPVTGEDTPDFSSAHLIYMGCGTERTQKAVLQWLLPHAGGLRAALDRGAAVLFTGNAMDLLGRSVTDREGKSWEGLGLGDFTTAETEKRTPHDVIATPALWEGAAVGFMNKCSTASGVTSPLFTALSMGFGNDREGGGEGFISGDLYATHITGPVLVKNPAFTDYLVGRLFALHGWDLPEVRPAYPHEAAAYAVTLRVLSARLRGLRAPHGRPAAAIQ